MATIEEVFAWLEPGNTNAADEYMALTFYQPGEDDEVKLGNIFWLVEREKIRREIQKILPEIERYYGMSEEEVREDLETISWRNKRPALIGTDEVFAPFSVMDSVERLLYRFCIVHINSMNDVHDWMSAFLDDMAVQAYRRDPDKTRLLGVDYADERTQSYAEDYLFERYPCRLMSEIRAEYPPEFNYDSEREHEAEEYLLSILGNEKHHTWWDSLVAVLAYTLDVSA